jgi:hypothetical protein
VLNQGYCASSGATPVGDMLVNSLIMALAIALGKIAISLISAFAIVYFRFPGRMLFLLGDLRHPDAAGRGPHPADLRGRGLARAC